MSDHFMSLEKTGLIWWATADHQNGEGTGPIPLGDLLNLRESVLDDIYGPAAPCGDSRPLPLALAACIADQLTADGHDDIDPESVRVFRHYGARLSASGYLDCTDYVTDRDEESLAQEVDRFLGRCYGCDRDTESDCEPMRVRVSESDDAEMPDGTLVPCGTEGSQSFCSVYACRYCAMLDQSIDGSHWETPSDIDEGYAIVVGDIDSVTERLEADGYEVEQD